MKETKNLASKAIRSVWTILDLIILVLMVEAPEFAVFVF